MRDFEKIDFEQFKKDVEDNRELYDEFELPSRSTRCAVGYDIKLLKDVTINPGEIVKIPTGLKSYFLPDEGLFLYVRSGAGFKYNLRLCNQVGIIDADYYYNKDNGGHIWFKIQNEGPETVTYKKSESLIQGVFMKYLTTDSDTGNNNERKGKY